MGSGVGAEPRLETGRRGRDANQVCVCISGVSLGDRIVEHDGDDNVKPGENKPVRRWQQRSTKSPSKKCIWLQSALVTLRSGGASLRNEPDKAVGALIKRSLCSDARSDIGRRGEAARDLSGMRTSNIGDDAVEVSLRIHVRKAFTDCLI